MGQTHGRELPMTSISLWIMRAKRMEDNAEKNTWTVVNLMKRTSKMLCGWRKMRRNYTTSTCNMDLLGPILKVFSTISTLFSYHRSINCIKNRFYCKIRKIARDLMSYQKTDVRYHRGLINFNNISGILDLGASLRTWISENNY